MAPPTAVSHPEGTTHPTVDHPEVLNLHRSAAGQRILPQPAAKKPGVPFQGAEAGQAHDCCIETAQQSHSQGLPESPPLVGDLGPSYRHRHLGPLRGDLPRRPQTRQHDQVGQGDRPIPRERSRRKERTQPEPAGRRPRAVVLLDLRQSGRGWAQGMESQSPELVEGVRRLRAHRGRQPLPDPVLLYPVLPYRTRRRKRRPSDRRPWTGGRRPLESLRESPPRAAGAEEPKAKSSP